MAFYKILTQVFVLILLIGVGYGAGKIKWLTDNGAKELTDILVNIVSPVVIVFAFQIKYTQARASGLMLSTLSAVGVHIFAIVLATLLFRRRNVPNDERRNILRFGSIYSNSGFMGLPLLDALAGTEGVFYGSVYIAVFNLFCWTHGYSLFTGKAGKKSILKVILNPNLIAIAIGMIFFFLSIRLPQPIETGMQYIYNLNTPLSMLIIGNRLSKFELKSLFTDKWVWPGVLMRNLAIPFCLVSVLHLCGLRGMTLLLCSLSAACPVAANTVLFAELTNKSTEFPTKLMMVSTLLCIGTIPLIVAFGTFLSGL